MPPNKTARSSSPGIEEARLAEVPILALQTSSGHPAEPLAVDPPPRSPKSTSGGSPSTIRRAPQSGSLPTKPAFAQVNAQIQPIACPSSAEVRPVPGRDSCRVCQREAYDGMTLICVLPLCLMSVGDLRILEELTESGTDGGALLGCPILQVSRPKPNS